MLRKLCFTVLLAGLSPTAVSAAIEEIELPPSQTNGLDMIVIDEGAVPAEPELAKHRAQVEDISWSGSAIDLIMPMHHLYTDFRRQLSRYRATWGELPQVRVPGAGALMAQGTSDQRVPLLRERLGLSRDGKFDGALQAKLAEFQRAHGLTADGKAGPATLAALNKGAAYYERRILLNMERARRLPASDMKGKYVVVDAGSARLVMYEDGRAVGSMKVIVGAPQTETPMMAALIRFASVNPYWNVPPEFLQKTMAPRIVSEGVTYLKDRRYEVLDGWNADANLVDPATVDWRAIMAGSTDVRVRQLPGANNSMGDIKFMLPNEYGIYLHDTPNKALFAEEERWVSNGCVRVEDAPRLARFLFGEMPRGASPDREENVDLEKPVPVYLTYFTVGAEGGGLTFRPDRYSRDEAVLARFDGDGDGMIDPVAPEAETETL